MTFEVWLETKGVSRKAFELRGTTVQNEMIDEYNNEQRKIGKMKIC